MAKPRYEARLVLFIDFLGFKEIVARTTKDRQELIHLVAAIERLGKTGDESIFKSQRITQFSDSVVVSYRVEEVSGVFWLLHSIALTVISLAGRGYLLRGAVTWGDLYHTKKYLVGPAMVAAYELESKRAISPRILLDEKIIQIARKNKSDMHSPKEEENYVRSFMAKDRDGLYFFDYISWHSVIEVAGGNDAGYARYLSKISSLIETGLQHPDATVLVKYLWMHRQYHAAIKEFERIPADHPYRGQSPGVWLSVHNLPRYVKLAQEAKRRVKIEAERAKRHSQRKRGVGKLS